MRIHRYMGVTKASFCLLLVLLLVAAFSFIEKKETQEDFFARLLDPASGLLDEHTAEVLLTTCWEDLIHLKKEVEDLDLCLLPESSSSPNKISSEIRPLARENIQKLIYACHPQFKQNFLHCLRKNNLPLHVFGEEDDSKIWHAAYSGLLFSGSIVPRRNLGRVLLQQISEVPSPGPALGSPTPSLAPSPSPNLAPSPTPNLAPSPTPNLAPSAPATFFPKLTPPAAANISAPPTSVANNIKADEHSNNNKTVVLAVVITAVVTFIVAALLFLCCCRFCKTGQARQNDESPLLSLRMSDYSVGYSNYDFGNAIKGERLGLQSSSNNLVDDKKTSVLESQSIGAVSASGRSTFELKPPSERVGTIPSGMPPLKPPPGRPVPLPPEPPSFRPSGNAAAAPPPPASPPPGFGGTPPPRPPPPPERVTTIPSGMLHLKPPPGRSNPLPPEPPSFRPSGNAAAAAAAPPPPPVHPQPGVGGTPPPRPPPPPGPPPPPPQAPSGVKPGPRPPPPPPKSGMAPPRAPPPIGPKGAQQNKAKSTGDFGAGTEGEAGAHKAKLKPFFWDKVQANSDQSMVWNQIKSGSFQFNEEMIETLFGYSADDKNKGQRPKASSSLDPSPQSIQIIDRKKAQNLLIMLRAWNVSVEEVSDALNEGNELPSEFLQTLLKMAPTSEEELKLRLFSDELSKLGPADRFLKVLIDIPFAFKRMEALIFMGTLKEDVTATKESFAILEVACKELRNSRLFLKLLEAVLKTGNRMNVGTFRGGAQAFKLDTLLKLSDVKGTDGKTTLLHFVVQEIIRTEGVRAARVAKESKSFSSIKTDELLEDVSDETEDHYREIGLQVVSRLSSELQNVKKASVIDADSLTRTTAKLGHDLVKARELVNRDLKNIDEDKGFYETLKSFVQDAESDIMSLLDDEKKIMALVKSTGDYFHGNAGKDEGLRLFVIVRDFLIMLDKVCMEVRDAQKKLGRTPK